jgi:hypothetical protein
MPMMHELARDPMVGKCYCQYPDTEALAKVGFKWKRLTSLQNHALHTSSLLDSKVVVKT